MIRSLARGARSPRGSLARSEESLSGRPFFCWFFSLAGSDRLSVMPKTDRYTPGRGLIKGMRQLKAYTGFDPRTLRKWSAKYGFPLAFSPQGRYISSVTLINAWILARRKAQLVAGVLESETVISQADNGLREDRLSA